MPALSGVGSWNVKDVLTVFLALASTPSPQLALDVVPECCWRREAFCLAPQGRALGRSGHPKARWLHYS